MRRHVPLARWLACLALALAACNGWQHPAVHATPRTGTLWIHAVDTAGDVAGAVVSVAGHTASTGADGRVAFEGLGEGGYLVTGEAPAHEPAALPVVARFHASASVEAAIFLGATDASDVRMLYAGDLSFEGSISDPNRDGIETDSLVPTGAGAAAGVSRLLADVSPLFEKFALVTATLATTLGDGSTPHPLKRDRAVAPAEVAAAFPAARIDVVNLGNDHAYDYLDSGVRQTLEALDGQGMLRLGAGRDLTEASAPLLVSRGGVTVGQTSLSARLGHGTTSRTDTPPYFEAGPDKAGVVPATLSNVQTAAAQLVSQGADFRVVHLAAGEEWSVNTAELSPLAAAAASGGASLVLGHSPRPLQPLFWEGSTLVAGGLGQLVFGSHRPEGRFGLLLDLRLRQRRLDAVRLWPIAQVQLRPRLAADALGLRIVRRAAALSAPSALVYPLRGRGEIALSPGAVQAVDELHQAELELRDLPDGTGATAPLPLLAEEPEGFVASAGAAATGAGPLAIELGRELLWSGGFEDETTGTLGEGGGWTFHAPDSGISDVSVRTGQLALELVRKSGNAGAATVRGEGLLTLRAGYRYTFSGCWRAEGEAIAQASLAIYPSRALDASPIFRMTASSQPSADWSCFTLEHTPTVDTLVAPELRLERPEQGTARLFVDDVSLIEWSAPPTPLTVPNDWEYLRGLAPAPVGTATVSWSTRRYVPR